QRLFERHLSVPERLREPLRGLPCPFHRLRNAPGVLGDLGQVPEDRPGGRETPRRGGGELVERAGRALDERPKRVDRDAELVRDRFELFGGEGGVVRGESEPEEVPVGPRRRVRYRR